MQTPPETKALYYKSVLFLLALTLSACNRSNTDTPAPKPANPAQPATQTANAPAASTNATPVAPAASGPPVIVKDNFAEDKDADEYHNIGIDGVKPLPIDLPDTPWKLASGDGGYEANLTAPGELGCLASFHNVASAGLNLASHGSYTKPAVMSLSADLSFDGDLKTGCCVLGFYSTLAGPHTSNVLANFTGLALQSDGSLQLVENGVNKGAAIKFAGEYNSNRNTTVSYSINTADGSISNVSVAGSNSLYDIKSSAFTNAATAFLGIGGQTNGNGLSYFNNLVLVSGSTLPPKAP